MSPSDASPSFEIPLARLADLIARRDLSSHEVVAACLERIAAVNPVLNAVVQVRPEATLAEADAADRDLGHGQLRGPLHGIPFTVKDWIDAAGLPCTGGMVAHRDRMPARDATVVARLRAAGGILLGKTNVGVQNQVYGRTTTPTTRGTAPPAARVARRPPSPPADRPWAWAATRAAASANPRTAVAWPASSRPPAACH